MTPERILREMASNREEINRFAEFIDFLRETYKDNSNEVGWPESLRLPNYNAFGTLRVSRPAISLNLLIFRPRTDHKDMRTDEQIKDDLTKEMHGDRLVELKKKRAILERELKELDDDINWLESRYKTNDTR